MMLEREEFIASQEDGKLRISSVKCHVSTLTNQYCIQEEIKSRLNLGNACYLSVQNISSSSLLSKTL